jgi:hypothetical protein
MVIFVKFLSNNFWESIMPIWEFDELDANWRDWASKNVLGMCGEVDEIHVKKLLWGKEQHLNKVQMDLFEMSKRNHNVE